MLGVNKTIAFDANSGSGTQTAGETTCLINTSYTLPECNFTAPDTGKKFKGWALTKDSETVIEPGKTCAITADIIKDGKVTFYAIWYEYKVEIIGAQEEKNLVYDGTPKVGYFGTITSGGYTGPYVATYKGTGTTTYGPETAPPTDAGTYQVTLSLPADCGYELASTPSSIYFVIAKAKVTITADDKSAYVGDTAPTPTYTVKGLVGTDKLETQPVAKYENTPDMSKAGTTTIKVSGAMLPADNPNYEADIEYVDGTLTVSNRPASGGNDSDDSDSDGGEDHSSGDSSSEPSTTITPAPTQAQTEGTTILTTLAQGEKSLMSDSDKATDFLKPFIKGTDANDTIPVEVRNMVTGESYFMNISLSYDGEFGLTAVLSVNLKPENAGCFANLYYDNEQTGEMEFICSDEIAEDGTAELTFTHASEYIIVIDEAALDAPASSEEGILPEIGVEAEGDNSSDATDVSDPLELGSDDNGSAWWIILLIAILAVVGVAGVLIYSKKNKENS